MARRHGRPAWSTSAAAGVATAITLAFAAYAVAAVTGLDATQAAGSREATLLGLDGHRERMVTVVTAVLVLAVSGITAAGRGGLGGADRGARPRHRCAPAAPRHRGRLRPRRAAAQPPAEPGVIAHCRAAPGLAPPGWSPTLNQHVG